jgi:Mn2+/Fe2+ NRAMP family transporter
MKTFLEVFLGILTAVGGFVEIGELVFSVNAGARFCFSLLGVVALGTLGIKVYSEMAGRIAAVTGQPIFSIIRERAGYTAGLGTLLAALATSLLTCAAEVGGVALILKLLFGGNYFVLVLVGLLFFLLAVWFLSFQAIERIFGLLGLLMIIFVVSAVWIQPDWNEVGKGFIPGLPVVETDQEYFSYAYFAVALLSSIMLPYETYFYAAGAIEDGWNATYLRLNRVIVIVGFALGSTLGMSLLVLGATFFGPMMIEPQLPGTVAILPAIQFGKTGLFIALLGMFCVMSGAAIENALTCAYDLSHFMGWTWGKFRPPKDAPRLNAAWIFVFVAATAIILTGVDPVQVVEYAIVFSVVILPLTFLPILLTAGDRDYMGTFANGWIARSLGWFFLVIISIAAVAAIPLLIYTHGGKL